MLISTVIWSLALSNTTDITSRLTTICVTFAGNGLGGIIGGAYWTATLPKDAALAMAHDGSLGFDGDFLRSVAPSYVAFISVVYGLSILTFIAWYSYYWWANRRLAHETGYERPLVAPSDRSQISGTLGNEGPAERGGRFRYSA